jgi:predicted ATPase
MAQAQAGHGQVAALVGEPGVGKSRLVWEVTHSHRSEGWLILESGSVSYGKATSYLPIIDLLKAYCRIETADAARMVREKVTGKLLTLDRALEPCVPALLALLDALADDAAWQALDPAQRRRQTLDAVERLLLRESQEQPLLLVFEDLHWIDSETQALLDSLVERLPATRILLLVNYRPEYRHTWGSKACYSQLRIDPLGEAGADELLASLLGDDPSVEPLTELLMTRTEGNPLFLEESVRALVETGALAGERAAYRLVSPVTSVRVPATVQAVLSARIDRLPAPEKALLQTAAVIGKDVPDALLRAIAERTEDELQRGLATLQAAEFLYQARLFPEMEYTFKHALTHEVTYGSLLQERRKTLHAGVVSAIEAAYPDRLDEHVELLAHHAFRAELWEPAMRYANAAGQKAAGRSAHRESVEHYERALAASDYLPPSRATHDLGIDIRLNLRDALDPLSLRDLQLQYLREAEQLALQIGDRRRLGIVYAQMSHSYLMQGESSQALDRCREALAIAEEIGDVALMVHVTLRLARLHGERGELQRSTEVLRLRLRDLENLSDQGHLGQTVSHIRSNFTAQLARDLSDLGKMDEAIALGEEAVHWADMARHPHVMGVSRNILGLVLLGRGNLERAAPILEGALAILEGADVPESQPWSLAILGAVRTLAGRLMAWRRSSGRSSLPR